MRANFADTTASDRRGYERANRRVERRTDSGRLIVFFFECED